MRGYNSAQVALRNRALIMYLLTRRGPLARREIAALTGLTSGSISVITGELLAEGLLRKSPRPPDEGGGLGPKPVPLEVNPGARVVLAACLYEQFLKIGVLNLRNELLNMRYVAMAPGYTCEDAARVIRDALDRMEGEMRSRLLGVGVAVPGPYDPDDDLLIEDAILGWRQVRLREALGRLIEAPLVVESKVPAKALSEYLFGRAGQASSLMLVQVGEGIGAGIVINGEIFRGTIGTTGEIGHARVPGGTRPCRCGRVGCVEAESSLSAILAAAGLGGRPDDYRTLVERLRRGDPEVTRVAVERLQPLKNALECVVQVLGPERLILTGTLVESDVVYETLTKDLAGLLGRPPQVSRTSFPGWSGLAGIGAVCLSEWLYPQGRFVREAAALRPGRERDMA